MYLIKLWNEFWTKCWLEGAWMDWNHMQVSYPNKKASKWLKSDDRIHKGENTWISFKWKGNYDTSLKATKSPSLHMLSHFVVTHVSSTQNDFWMPFKTWNLKMILILGAFLHAPSSQHFGQKLCYTWKELMASPVWILWASGLRIDLNR